MFTDEEKYQAAMREVRMRQRTYPGWIAKGRMTKAQADHEIAVMQQIAQDYELAARQQDLFNAARR